MHFVAGGAFAGLAVVSLVVGSVATAWGCLVIANVWLATAPRKQR